MKVNGIHTYSHKLTIAGSNSAPYLLMPPSTFKIQQYPCFIKKSDALFDVTPVLHEINKGFYFDPKLLYN